MWEILLNKQLWPGTAKTSRMPTVFLAMILVSQVPLTRTWQWTNSVVPDMSHLTWCLCHTCLLNTSVLSWSRCSVGSRRVGSWTPWLAPEFWATRDWSQSFGRTSWFPIWGSTFLPPRLLPSGWTKKKPGYILVVDVTTCQELTMRWCGYCRRVMDVDVVHSTRVPCVCVSECVTRLLARLLQTHFVNWHSPDVTADAGCQWHFVS